MFDLTKLVARTSSWLDGSGPQTNLVLSSRVRLARNVKSYRFTHFTKPDENVQLYKQLMEVLRKCPSIGGGLELNLKEISPMDRHLLVERHLISLDLEKSKLECGVYVAEDEQVSIMVNEEDHLRLQAILSGFQPAKAYEIINRVDDEISRSIDYAYTEKLGYLTACPTNTGTGMRVSVLIHLPALVLTKSIDEILKGISQVGLSIRGFYGEGTEVLGNIFQISNQTTLGKTESEIIETIDRVIQQVIGFETNACSTLLRDAPTQIEDKIWRAYGILKNARMLTSTEFMSLSSAMRLGVALGLIKNINIRSLNELLPLIQPVHLQKWLGKEMEATERDVHRADIVRKKLGGVSSAAPQEMQKNASS